MSAQPFVLDNRSGDRIVALQAQLRFLCTGAQTGHKWSVMEATLPQNAGPPLHEHPWDEAYYMLEGEVRFTVGERTVTVRKGDFIYAPGGTLHAFQNPLPAPARMLIFDAPAHAEGFFREAEREVVNYPADLAKVPAIGQRHGLRFIPPAA